MAAKKKTTTKKPEKAESKSAARKYTQDELKLLIIGDDGKLYQLMEKDWKKNPVKESATIGTTEVLKAAGSYLAFLDPEASVGAGMACTLVNLAAVLKGIPSKE